MTQKERLVELLNGCPANYAFMYDGDFNLFESLADHLLSNGVIVPPCKVGDTVYSLERDLWGNPVSQSVEFIWFTEDQIILTTKSWNVSTAWLGNSYFLSRKAAQQALKEREKE